jgi:hypothetical protein
MAQITDSYGSNQGLKWAAGKLTGAKKANPYSHWPSESSLYLVYLHTFANMLWPAAQVRGPFD